MPAKSERQRRFFGAELGRLREGKKTRTGLSETKLEDFATMKKTKIMSKGTFSSPSGDIGEKRGMEATKAIKAFKGDGKVMKAASYFGSATPNASKAGNSPS